MEELQSKLQGSNKLVFRNDIQFLRAISVIAVILFHCELIIYDFKLFTGGFLGVDIFFVVSGYLITSIVLKEIKNKNFNYFNFIIRRAKRILPTLLVTIIFSFILAFYNFSLYELVKFKKFIISAITFFSNFYLILENSSYWNNNFDNFLIHTWSLSVEIQFYILFPFIIQLILKKFNIDFLLKLFIFVSIISLYISSKLSVNEMFFFNSFGRIFEFLMGGICGILIKQNNFSINIFLRNFLVTFSILIILTSFLIFDESIMHPSMFTLISIFPTGIIILLNQKDSHVDKVISNTTSIFFGKISYSLYLFHLPILYILSNNIFEKFLAIVISISFSWFNFQLIEKKFIKDVKNKNFIIFIIISYLLIILSSIIIIKTNGLEKYNFKRFTHQNFEIEKIIMEAKKSGKYDMVYKDYNNCKIWNVNFNKKISKIYEECSKKFKKKILILGDSHSVDLYNMFYLYKKDKNSVLLNFDSECRSDNSLRECRKNINLNYFLNQQKVDVIYYHVSGEYFFDHLDNIDLKYIEMLKKFIIELKKISKSVIFVGPRINPDIELNQKNLMIFLKQPEKLDNYDKYLKYYKLDSLLEKKFKNIDKLNYFSLINLLKFDIKRDFLYNNKLTFSDLDHYSNYGEVIFGEKIVNEIYNKYIKKN